MAGFKEYQMLFSLNASVESGFHSAFNSGSSEVARLQGSINNLNKTASDISAYQKQQSAIDKTKAKIDLYKTQLENLRNATATTSKEEAELANSIAAKEKQLSDSEKTLARQEGTLNEMGDALRNAGINVDNLGAAQEGLKAKTDALKNAQMEAAGSTQTMNEAMEGLRDALVAIGAEKALSAIYNQLKDSSQMAAEYETAMAAVKRTVGGTDDFIQNLGAEFKNLSTEMPITANELASIAATAGQLGIAQENVQDFTTVMAMLATTTDLTADNAATMLAQFANITGTTNYARLGSTVAALGDSTATTASKVVEMSQGMAAAANIAGMSETDILAISAAVGSLGIESQAGSTAMSQLITTLYKSTETGEKLEDFASVAGMSAGQFASAWSSSPVDAMNTFIQGLNDTERNGKSAMVILDELGISNVRQVKAILGLASAGDLLSNTINQANNAWDENTALTEKAGIMYNTTEAKLNMLQNSANNLSIAVGDALNPAVGTVATGLTGLLEPIAEFVSNNPQIIQGLTATVGAFGSATLAISGYSAAVKLAATVGKVLSASTPLGWIAGGALAIGGLVTAIGYLTSANGEAGKSFEELQEEYEDLQQSYEDNQHVIDLVDQYHKLSAEIETISDIDPGDITLKARIEAGTVTPETLKRIDELKNRIDNETGELKQILTIAGADNVTDENLNAITELASSAEDGDHELKQQLALLGADNISDDDLAKLRELSSALKDDSATLSETLQLNGFENYDDMKAALDLPVSSKAAEIIVSLGTSGYDDLIKKLQGIGSQVISTKQELETAQGKLGELQTQAAQLQEKIDSTRNKRDKTQLQEDLEEVNAQIKQQESIVAALEESHNSLVTQYDATASAADELKAKEDALKQTKEELAAAMGGVVAGSQEEAEALYDAAAATAEANNALIRQKLYGNLSQQADKYADSIREVSTAENSYNDTLKKVNAANLVSGYSIDEINSYYQGLLTTLDEMKNAEGFDPESIDYQNAIDQAEAFRNIFQGWDEDLNQYSGEVQSWVKAFGSLGVTEDQWVNSMARMNEYVVEYRNEIDTAKASQNEFLSQIADGVLSGAVKIEDVEQRLSAVWADEADSEELVASVIDYVNGLLQAQAEAAEQAAEANNQLADSGSEISDSTKQQAESIQTTIDAIEDLKKSYEEAYQAAYDSMDGQFSLFEKVKGISAPTTWNAKKSLSQYTAGLESQKAYMESYSEYYAQAAEKVRAADSSAEGVVANSFLSQLADGSAESAEILANIATATPEQVSAMVQAYADVQAAKDEYAATMAETETNFSESMAQLQADLESTVQAMDFSGEAASNAQASLNAFISQADGYVGKAAAAYAKVAAAAAAALKFNPTVPGYASGTEYATSGVRLVGEEGPELVFFRGGERVLNADQTVEALSAKPIQAMPIDSGSAERSGGSTYNIDVTIPNINAKGVDAEEVVAAIAGTLRDEIVNTMEEIEEDRYRRNLV